MATAYTKGGPRLFHGERSRGWFRHDSWCAENTMEWRSLEPRIRSTLQKQMLAIMWALAGSLAVFVAWTWDFLPLILHADVLLFFSFATVVALLILSFRKLLAPFNPSTDGGRQPQAGQKQDRIRAELMQRMKSATAAALLTLRARSSPYPPASPSGATVSVDMYRRVCRESDNLRTELNMREDELTVLSHTFISSLLEAEAKVCDVHAANTRMISQIVQQRESAGVCTRTLSNSLRQSEAEICECLNQVVYAEGNAKLSSYHAECEAKTSAACARVLANSILQAEAEIQLVGEMSAELKATLCTSTITSHYGDERIHNSNSEQANAMLLTQLEQLSEDVLEYKRQLQCQLAESEELKRQVASYQQDLYAASKGNKRNSMASQHYKWPVNTELLTEQSDEKSIEVGEAKSQLEMQRSENAKLKDELQLTLHSLKIAKNEELGNYTAFKECKQRLESQLSHNKALRKELEQCRKNLDKAREAELSNRLAIQENKVLRDELEKHARCFSNDDSHVHRKDPSSIITGNRSVLIENDERSVLRSRLREELREHQCQVQILKNELDAFDQSSSNVGELRQVSMDYSVALHLAQRVVRNRRMAFSYWRECAMLSRLRRQERDERRRTVEALKVQSEQAVRIERQQKAVSDMALRSIVVSSVTQRLRANGVRVQAGSVAGLGRYVYDFE